MQNNIKNIRVVFGTIPIAGGFAGNKRIRNLAVYLCDFNELSIENIYISNNEIINEESFWGNITFSKVNSNYRFFRIWKFFWRLKQTKVKDKKNVLYFYGYPDTFNFWMFPLLRLIGYKIIVDIVEDNSSYENFTGIVNKLNIKFSIILLKRITLFADAVIAISDYLQKKMVGYVKKQVPVVKLPISIDPKDFVRTLPSKTNKVKIFYGGTFNYKDGVQELIIAFNELSLKHENIELILSGIGLNKDILHLNALIKDINNMNISYLGFLSEPEYIEMLYSCDILCMPRRNNPYAIAGFPFKLGEYLATGNAVLASSIGEIPLLFSSEELCLYNPDIEDSLHQRLELLISDEQKRNTLGKNGRKKSLEIFNAQNHATILYELINNL